jgi:hypothetical protein
MVLISAAKKMVSATISTLLRPGDWIQITSSGASAMMGTA